MHDQQQLGEQDDVNDVGAQVPASTRGDMLNLLFGIVWREKGETAGLTRGRKWS